MSTEHHLAKTLASIGASSSTRQLIRMFFDNKCTDNPVLLDFFETVFPADEALVVLPHQGLFIQRWMALVRTNRMYPCQAGPNTVRVRYSCCVTHINGQPMIGTLHYPAQMALDLISTLLMSRTDTANRFASVCDIPKNLVNALLLPTTPNTLYQQFCEQWIDLDAYDVRFIDVYRRDLTRLNQFYVEPVSSANNATGSTIMKDYSNLVTSSRLGEWWARQRRCAGTTLIVTLYVFFDLEAEFVKSRISAQEWAVLGVDSLQKLFPLALWLTIESEPQYIQEYCEQLVTNAPTIAAMLQRFIDAARMYMADQVQDVTTARNGFLTDPMWKQARMACATLRNIRVCIDPHIEALERFEHASLTQISSDVRTREGRSQRMQYFAATRCRLFEFLYETLIGELNNMAETRALLDWLYTEAYDLSGAATVRGCSRDQTFETPRDPAVQTMIKRIDEQFMVLMFFGNEQWPAGTLFSLRCTMMAIGQNYPELGLSEVCTHYLGHCQRGPYLVIERRALWMLQHATSTLALTSPARCYMKTAPVYGELLRTYFTRMDTRDQTAEELRTKPDVFNFLWSGDGQSIPFPPARIHPNLFSHACFVQIFCEWLGIPSEYISDNVVVNKWRLAVPPPNTPAFGCTRFLHRITDLLHQGGVAALVRGGYGRVQYWLDDDDMALNTIRSYLQMEAPHTLSIASLKTLAKRFNDDLTFYDRYQDLYFVVRELDIDNTDCAAACDSWFAEIHDTHLDYHPTLSPFMQHKAATTAISFDAMRRRRIQDGAIVGSIGNKRTYATSVATDVKPRTGRATARRSTGAAESINLLEITATRHNITDQLTAEVILDDRIENVDEQRRNEVLQRIALLPSRQVIDRLPEGHSLRLLYYKGAAPRELLAHINLLFYEPILCGDFEPLVARRFLCDLKVGGLPLVGNELFSNARYRGSKQQALQHFRTMHARGEHLILSVENDPTGRILAYNSAEPRDQFYTLLRHLDYRHTVGATEAGQKINAAIDNILAAGVQTSALFPENQQNELPVFMEMRHLDELEIDIGTAPISCLYPSNSMVLISTVGESHLAECFQGYIQHWEFASHLAAVIGIDTYANRIASKTHCCDEWQRGVRSRIERARLKIEADNDADDMRLEAAIGGGLQSALDFLGF